ncbi:hypothetical protein QQ045_017098 [Rhodiola kirilowii]
MEIVSSSFSVSEESPGDGLLNLLTGRVGERSDEGANGFYSKVRAHISMEEESDQQQQQCLFVSSVVIGDINSMSQTTDFTEEMKANVQ